MATCSSCGAGVVWVLTEKGKRMPVDVAPHPDGNLHLFDQDGERYSRVTGAAIDMLDPADDGTRYRSHFVTCPQSTEHRRKR